MSVAVIDRLEVVRVDQQQSKGTSGTLRTVDLIFCHLQKMTAVEHTRKSVASGQLGKLFIRFDELCLLSCQFLCAYGNFSLQLHLPSSNHGGTQAYDKDDGGRSSDKPQHQKPGTLVPCC